MTDDILDSFELKRDKNTNVVSKTLLNNTIIDFKTEHGIILIGSEAYIEAEKVNVGLYRIQEEDVRYEIENGKLIHEYYIEKYKQKSGEIIEVDGSRFYGIIAGSKVWKEEKRVEDGTYKMGWLLKMEVKNSVIQRIFIL
jgi:hypothetical protein